MDTSDPGPSIDELREACTRFLVGHGRPTPQETLEEISQVLDGASGDTYSSGGIVEVLEAEIGELLGKPAAVLMPTGTNGPAP
jgi:threonine aldolase